MQNQRKDDTFIDVQRMPGHVRPPRIPPSTRAIDPTIHTAERPFCFDPACSCHEQRQAIALVNVWVEQGLLTENEATNFIAGRTL
jgi:hypothetical protein